MSVSLLLPGALLALAALVLPILLHLARQNDRTRVEFAALRWLTARAQPRRRPRLDEWLLLILRLLLLTLIALWLAQPVLLGQADERPWLLVHPAIGASRAPLSSAADEQRRWLAPGFPTLEQPVPSATASIGSLLRELDAALPANAAMRVLVPAQFDATDAERPVLQREVTWTAVPGATAFAKQYPPQAARMAVYADPAHRAALPYLRAAAAAWASTTPAARKPATLRAMSKAGALHASDTHLLWLGAAPVPASSADWVRAGGVALLAHNTRHDIDWSTASVAWRDIDGTPLARRVRDSNGAWIRLLVPFDAQSLPALLEPEFPRALQDLLATSPDIATRATAEGYFSTTGATSRYPESSRPLGSWLAWLIALLFAIERWLAASPRRIGR